jgi:rRNA maturation endonuclease Nob1
MEKADIECIITESTLQGYSYKTIKYRYICPNCLMHGFKVTVLDQTPFCPQCGQKVSYPKMPSGSIVKLYEFNGTFLVSED